jgi:tRNA threonylcarbamoyladenosine biosynthesis protein TsaE
MSLREITSVESMREFGEALGKKLIAGDIIVLQGDLGAGKTALTQGIGKALGFSDITSPTFVISRVHEGPIPLIHVDAYRLLGANQNFEFDDLDLDTLREKAITVIEWGDDIAVRLSEDYLLLAMTFGSHEESRYVGIEGRGARWQGFSL